MMDAFPEFFTSVGVEQAILKIVNLEFRATVLPLTCFINIAFIFVYLDYGACRCGISVPVQIPYPVTPRKHVQYCQVAAFYNFQSTISKKNETEISVLVQVGFIYTTSFNFVVCWVFCSFRGVAQVRYPCTKKIGPNNLV